MELESIHLNRDELPGPLGIPPERGTEVDVVGVSADGHSVLAARRWEPGRDQRFVDP